MSPFWKDVLKGVTVAVLIGILSLVWSTYHEILDMRDDVDNLYSEVSEHMQEHGD